MRSRRPRNRGADGGCEAEYERVERLYEEYAPRIGAYALRRTNQADAADVVAETFLVAWRRRDAMPAEPMTLPWLYGVARRILANQHRTRHRRTRLHDRLAGQFIEDEAKPSRLEGAEDMQRVHAALTKLSDNDAELLRLAAWEALSPSEIAEVMSLEPAAVRQRLHRARKRLRKQLVAQGFDYGPEIKTRTRGYPAPMAGRHHIAALGWGLSDYGR